MGPWGLGLETVGGCLLGIPGDGQRKKLLFPQARERWQGVAGRQCDQWAGQREMTSWGRFSCNAIILGPGRREVGGGLPCERGW